MDPIIAKRFGVPDAAEGYLDTFLTAEDQVLIRGLKKEVFDREAVASVLGGEAEDYIASAYRRGVLCIEDEAHELYRLGSFYGMLDIFAITEAAVWRTLPREVRERLDDWYFDEYCAPFDPDRTVRPTPDEILPLDEVLAFIDRQDRPVYLNTCDCRALRGDCGLPTKTCITYRNGVNTFAHRGLSEEIDKERAKEIVRQADRDGLMHTVQPNGVCNCCGDCCYLFRAQRRRDSLGVWPKTERVIAFDAERCIGCALCTRRCHFGVFEKRDGAIAAQTERCVGCGVCATMCPGKALTLQRRAG